MGSILRIRHGNEAKRDKLPYSTLYCIALILSARRKVVCSILTVVDWAESGKWVRSTECRLEVNEGDSVKTSFTLARNFIHEESNY